MIRYYIQANGSSPEDAYDIERDEENHTPTYPTIEEAIENLHKVYEEIFGNSGLVTSLSVEIANPPMIAMNANPYEEPPRPRGWCNCHPERLEK